jgi:acyl-CoA dehydrogenase
MSMTPAAGYDDMRSGVRALCEEFPDEYFRKVNAERGYPAEFVAALTKAGWLAALIPPQYGGAGLSLAEASVIMEEINHAGGNSGACHGQMYVMNVLVRHGSEKQRAQYLPKIASGELRLQSMAMTEPTTAASSARRRCIFMAAWA